MTIGSESFTLKFSLGMLSSASATGRGMAGRFRIGVRQSLEESGESLLAGDPGPSALERLQHDALAAARGPAIQATHVGFFAGASGRKRFGCYRQREKFFRVRVDHRLPRIQSDLVGSVCNARRSDEKVRDKLGTGYLADNCPVRRGIWPVVSNAALVFHQPTVLQFVHTVTPV